MVCLLTSRAFVLMSTLSPTNIDGAYKMMLSCQKRGCSQCGVGMAFSHLYGRGCEKDIQLAHKLLSEGDPACQVSQYVMANCHDDGLGVDVDKGKAFALYHQSALAGFAPAQNVLALLLSIGSEGIPQDFEESMHWHKLAVHQGLSSSMFFIGLAYERGEGVTKSNEQAIKWYEFAWREGYDIAGGKLRKLRRILMLEAKVLTKAT
jgi:hypothetical protein